MIQLSHPPCDSRNPQQKQGKNKKHTPGHWQVKVFLILLIGVLASILSVPALSAEGCPLPREWGAGTWFLASMSSVDLCNLVNSNPVAPTAVSEATPTPNNPGEHVVAEGETLSEIALRYGTTAEALQEINGLDDPGQLAIGMVLRLDPVETEETATPAPREELAHETQLACPPASISRSLELDYEPIRLEAVRGVIYLLAGGDLYGLSVGDLEGEGPLRPIPLVPGNRRAGEIPIQELVDLTFDAVNEELVLLDKTGDLYGYHPGSGRWRVRMVAQSLPDYWLDPQFLTIANIGEVTYGLDVDGARLWRMAPGAAAPILERESAHLARTVDLAAMDDALYLLYADGTLAKITGQPVWPSLPRLARPSDLNAAPGEELLAVDADGRRLVLLNNERVIDITLRFAGMSRLGSAVQENGILYAVAGLDLYRIDPATPGDNCGAVTYDDRFIFGGIDLNRDLPDLALPFEGGVLPNRPRSYPGARRLYRFGIHEGVDFYEGDAPGLAYGSPVGAIAPGTVVRIDHDFREMTPPEYMVVMNEIYDLHSTPSHSLDKLRGQQVWVEHAPGIVSRYAHLSSVASVLEVGDTVAAGQVLGRVGVSGTSSGVYQSQSGFHLHWEIWINERYLGHGLTLRETMRLWRQIF